LQLFSFGGYGLALAALALVVFGAYDSYPIKCQVRLISGVVAKGGTQKVENSTFQIYSWSALSALFN